MPKPSGTMSEFQSTLPVRGATDSWGNSVSLTVFQSTLPVRGATYCCPGHAGSWVFQSTLPVRGATDKRAGGFRCFSVFQSTLPVRGATFRCIQAACTRPISIHAPREGSDALDKFLPGVYDISIHAPREGSDPGHKRKRRLNVIFQSTLPVRGATVSNQTRSLTSRYFNPRSP